jgi:hypothetical protein
MSKNAGVLGNSRVPSIDKLILKIKRNFQKRTGGDHCNSGEWIVESGELKKEGVLEDPFFF